eukprot:scaffold372559_cov29-Prasinocladus_malaysianus.AAC.1
MQRGDNTGHSHIFGARPDRSPGGQAGVQTPKGLKAAELQAYTLPPQTTEISNSPPLLGGSYTIYPLFLSRFVCLS